MRPRRRSGSTRGDCINDERREGYVVDPRGKVRGEARNYDPYSRFGEIMLYDIDAFGFVPGYVSKNWQIMSERDLLEDGRLARRLNEAKYMVWKRQNIIELKEEYERYKNVDKNFERFCREVFSRI